MSGPSPGTGCAVCEHPESAQINALVNSRRLSNRKIALRFGMSKDSVGRHVFKRHPGVDPVVAAGSRAPLPGEDGTVTELDRLRRIRVTLEAELDRAPRSDLSRELRQVNQRIAELEGTDRPKSVGVEDVAGLPEQVARWFEALEPFPDARDAMLAATDPALLEAAGVEA